MPGQLQVFEDLGVFFVVDVGVVDRIAGSDVENDSLIREICSF